MQIPVLIERIAGNGYVARTGEPLTVRAEGPTRDTALQNLRVLISDRLHDGSEMVSVQVTDAGNPWLAMAGMHDPNDPEIVAWKHAMAEYRDKVEAEPDVE